MADERAETGGTDATPRRRWRFRGSTGKRWLVLGFDALARVLPFPLLRASVTALIQAFRWSWVWPRQPGRIACEDVTLLAARAGIVHEPRAIYERLLDQFQAMGVAFLAMRRGRADATLERAAFTHDDQLKIEELLKQYGGLVLAVPHNVGAVAASLALASVVPTLVVAKGQKNPRRQALTREFFAQTGVDVMMVRESQAVALARACLRALKDGRVVVATLDLLYRKPNRVPVRMFGEEVGLAPWAHRFAVQRQVPLLPCYIRIDDGRLHVEWGDPLVSDSVEALVEHYARVLEGWVLRDPGSWGFLLDKRWRRVLRAAASR